ncbi:MAG: TlpA family protein disulfide reductase [Deltaproteobacteria bacterium]|nr:TlpA family protein disulfide reductase [Deltaproteobacteria bacterium]
MGAPHAAALAAVLALAGACAASGGGGASSAASVSARATDFTGRDIDGKTVRLSDYLGKQAILIDFAATWCTPCLAEIPHLRRIYEKERARGFVVLVVAMDGSETVAEVPAWARRNALTFPVVTDEDSQIASLYNPKKSAPLTVLIDKAGKIVYVHDGYNPGDEVALEEHVAHVLDPAPAKN